MTLTEQLAEIRFTSPDHVSHALARRPQGAPPAPGERLIFIALDHPARGALGAGDDEWAMASREDLLQRCITALENPGVRGFLGTPDLVEDLALLGALDGKLVLGSMNRAGIQGATFEIDDRMTAYDARGIVEGRLDGGKLLLRIDPSDAATAPMLERAARAIDSLSEARKVAMVEPFISGVRDGRIANDLSTEAVLKSVTIASALGRTSAWTWLKVPYVADMERVVGATTLPCLLLGGEVPEDAEQAMRDWEASLALPNVKGLVIGRTVLFPRDGDVAGAVQRLVEML